MIEHNALSRYFGVLLFLYSLIVAYGHFVLRSRLTPAVSTTVFASIVGIYRFIKYSALGLGSFYAKRWARTLLLLLSWFNFLIGLLSLPLIYWYGNHMTTTVPPTIPPPAHPSALAMVAYGFISSVLIPYAFIRFFSSEDVIKTCEAKNPVPAWTDACPLPVMGFAVITILHGSLIMAGVMLRNRMPILLWTAGTVTARVALLLIGLGTGYAGYLVYRMNSKGLILAAAISTITLLNGAIFIVTRGWTEYINHFIPSPKMITILTAAIPVLGPMIGFCSVAYFTYLIYLKNTYFKTHQS